MPVNDVLAKISERYPDVIGALVINDGYVFHNLTAPYDMVSADTIMKTFADIFEQAAMLAEEGYEFSDMVLDFASHSFIIRVIPDGLLVVLTGPLQRGQLVKLQVGLGLFAKSISDEIAKGGNFPESEGSSENDVAEKKGAAPQKEKSEEVVPVEGGFGFGFLKKLRKGQDAVSTAKPKGDDASSEDVPLGEDGKPRKVRMYRGVAFYD